MTTKTETVTFEVEIKREDAIRTGLSQYGKRDVEVDVAALSPAQREELLAGEDGLNRSYATPRPRVTTWDMDAVKALLDWRIAWREGIAETKAAELAKLREKVIADIEEFIAKPVGDRIPKETITGAPPHGFGRPYLPAEPNAISSPTRADIPADLLERFDAAVAETQAELERRHAEWRAKRDEEVAAKRAAAARREEATRRILEEHGTPNQTARFRAGLLPEKELRDLVRGTLFAPLAHVERYERMTTADAPADAYPDTVKFETRDPDGLPAEAFDVFEAIKEAAGKIDGAKVEAKAHVVTFETDDENEAERVRYSARVSVDFHGDKFALEYALPGGTI